MKTEEKQFMLDVARLTAARSKGVRLKVGSVVTDSNGDLVATGYNGTIRGFHTNTLEERIYQEEFSFSDSSYPYFDEVNGKCYRLVTNENISVHSEQNLIAHAARRGISIAGGTVFGTHSPCTKCTQLLIQCGIVEMVFLEKYRLHDAVESLYGQYIKLTHWSEDI